MIVYDTLFTTTCVTISNVSYTSIIMSGNDQKSLIQSVNSELKQVGYH